MSEVINIVREFDILVVLLIVFVTIILLGSFRIELSDGRFKFTFQWPGIKRKYKEKDIKEE